MASVLLVAVDDTDRATARSILEGVGHLVTEATTGTFLQVAGERPVDLVVIDISPLKHNVHLVGIMELRHRRPTLPILAVCSGRDAGTLLKIARQAGADATLQKPFTRDRLLQAVTRCLAGPAQP